MNTNPNNYDASRSTAGSTSNSNQNPDQRQNPNARRAPVTQVARQPRMQNRAASSDVMGRSVSGREPASITAGTRVNTLTNTPTNTPTNTRSNAPIITPAPKKMPSAMVLTLQILRDQLREMKASGNEGNQLVNVFRAIKQNEKQIRTAINEYPSAPELASFRNAYGLFLQRFDALLQEKGVVAVLRFDQQREKYGATDAQRSQADDEQEITDPGDEPERLNIGGLRTICLGLAVSVDPACEALFKHSENKDLIKTALQSTHVQLMKTALAHGFPHKIKSIGVLLDILNGMTRFLNEAMLTADETVCAVFAEALEMFAGWSEINYKKYFLSNHHIAKFAVQLNSIVEHMLVPLDAENKEKIRKCALNLCSEHALKRLAADIDPGYYVSTINVCNTIKDLADCKLLTPSNPVFAKSLAGLVGLLSSLPYKQLALSDPRALPNVANFLRNLIELEVHLQPAFQSNGGVSLLAACISQVVDAIHSEEFARSSPSAQNTVNLFSFIKLCGKQLLDEDASASSSSSSTSSTSSTSTSTSTSTSNTSTAASVKVCAALTEQQLSDACVQLCNKLLVLDLKVFNNRESLSAAILGLRYMLENFPQKAPPGLPGLLSALLAKVGDDAAQSWNAEKRGPLLIAIRVLLNLGAIKETEAIPALKCLLNLPARNQPYEWHEIAQAMADDAAINSDAAEINDTPAEVPPPEIAAPAPAAPVPVAEKSAPGQAGWVPPGGRPLVRPSPVVKVAENKTAAKKKKAPTKSAVRSAKVTTTQSVAASDKAGSSTTASSTSTASSISTSTSTSTSTTSSLDSARSSTNTTSARMASSNPQLVTKDKKKSAPLAPARQTPEIDKKPAEKSALSDKPKAVPAIPASPAWKSDTDEWVSKLQSTSGDPVERMKNLAKNNPALLHMKGGKDGSHSSLLMAILGGKPKITGWLANTIPREARDMPERLLESLFQAAGLTIAPGQQEALERYVGTLPAAAKKQLRQHFADKRPMIPAGWREVMMRLSLLSPLSVQEPSLVPPSPAALLQAPLPPTPLSPLSATRQIEPASPHESADDSEGHTEPTVSDDSVDDSEDDSVEEGNSNIPFPETLKIIEAAPLRIGHFSEQRRSDGSIAFVVPRLISDLQQATKNPTMTDLLKLTDVHDDDGKNIMLRFYELSGIGQLLEHFRLNPALAASQAAHQDNAGLNLLMRAVKKGDVRMVKLLLDNPATRLQQLTACDVAQGANAFAMALESKQYPIAAMLMEAAPKAGQELLILKNKDFLMAKLIRAGNLEGVRILLQHTSSMGDLLLWLDKDGKDAVQVARENGLPAIRENIETAFTEFDFAEYGRSLFQTKNLLLLVKALSSHPELVLRLGQSERDAVIKFGQAKGST